jgi:integrase
MANIRQLASGHWQVQIRLKGRKVTETFVRRDHAREWATEAEGQIDRGRSPTGKRARGVKSFGDLIDLHIDDMKEVGKPPGRSKSATLEMLQRELGAFKASELGREKLIKFGRDRAKQGAGPVTLSMDIGAIRLVISHAIAVHGVELSIEPVDMARIALKRLGLVGKSNERDRRPSKDEIDQLLKHFVSKSNRQQIPVAQVIKFAIATAMRQEEIFRVTWSDLNRRTRMLLIRDRKDPREKKGNDQEIPLLAVSGYDALALIEEQILQKKEGDDRIFPYNHKSAGTAFTRACQDLGIVDLHFHDLRHEGTSRLFEAGLAIQQVALVTGHKDWKMLKRYTHLKPASLHAFVAGRAA